MKTRSSRSLPQPPNDEFIRFTSSVEFDQRLWKYDIAGSIAHAHTLAKAGVLSTKESKIIIDALVQIAGAIEQGTLRFDSGLEDVHMNIEKFLIDDTGDSGRMLHTGRSRNDQVSLDMRLMIREAILTIALRLIDLQKEVVAKSRSSSGMVMPGFTHLQHAQPVLLSHHLLAHFWKLQRDFNRISDCYRRTNVSPLGSGAIAGTTYKLDRLVASKMLGMTGVTENSLDSVSDRDFVAETLFALSLLMVHLSSLSEEMIIWSSSEFGFVKLPETLSGGSSMMPQKRNPDIPELIRGKSGRAIGNLVTILTLLKSLPLAYNRDLQEDKEPLFDALDTTEASLDALTSFLRAMEFDKVRMRKSAEIGLMTATDLADFLTTRGVPFRAAHGLVKEIAKKSDGDDETFKSLAHKMAQELLGNVSESELNLLSLTRAVERRNTEGGTSPRAVAKQMDKALEKLSENRSLAAKMKRQVEKVDSLLS